MNRIVAAVGILALAVAGCSKRKEPAPVEGTGTGSAGSAAPLPDPLILDWQSLHYDLGSLGTVKATNGRADFNVIEDDNGAVHATQDPAVTAATSDATGYLNLESPSLVDLDGDRHEEAVIPFELQSAQAGSVFGLFVFTLRDGLPVQLGTVMLPKVNPGFTIEGKTIKLSDGTVWRWDTATKHLAH